MCSNSHTYSVTSYNGKFFDLMDNRNLLFITNYQRLDREIVLKSENDIELGGPVMRKEITSLSFLKTVLDGLVSASAQIITGEKNESKVFCDSEKSLLVEQLVFDILFDKYLSESEKMTRNGYATYMGNLLNLDSNDSILGMHDSQAINQRLTRSMATYHDRAAYSKLPEQIKMLGADPEKYAAYYESRAKENPKNKKPKYIWDMLYYNFVLEVANKQYRRQLTRSSRNYPYEKIIEDLKSYLNFVTKLLPQENESWEKYFRMSMDYYVLESYKRVDFIFRLVNSIPQMGIDVAEIDKKHFLVKRFHPEVLVPFVENNELHFGSKHNYYRPLFMVEDALHKDISNSSTPDYNSYAVKLRVYQVIRAKTYELFKYHCAFHSDDYKEIKEFLCECYDMRTYHHSNTFWNYTECRMEEYG